MNHSPPPPLDDQICYAIYSAGIAIQRTYKPLLDELGLTCPQYLVLDLLGADDGATAGSSPSSWRSDQHPGPAKSDLTRRLCPGPSHLGAASHRRISLDRRCLRRRIGEGPLPEGAPTSVHGAASPTGERVAWPGRLGLSGRSRGQCGAEKIQEDAHLAGELAARRVIGIEREALL